MLLPLPNLPAVIFICKNQVGLDPGNASPGIDKQLRNPVSAHAAVLVEVFPAFFGDGFDPALHGNAMGPAQQVQSLFIPQVNARLETDFYVPFGDAFQQAKHVLSYSEDLINEVDILHAPADQGIHLLQDRLYMALAEFIAKQSLVAEGTGPGASARKLQLCSNALIVSK